jgi:hypothetical protein
MWAEINKQPPHKNNKELSMEQKLRKIIVVDEVIDKVITNICNAALKFDGLPMIVNVNAIKGSIKEEELKSGDV